jgi:hypothetical protein
MVKEAKFFRKQAGKAERMARAPSDLEVSQGFLHGRGVPQPGGGAEGQAKISQETALMAPRRKPQKVSSGVLLRSVL